MALPSWVCEAADAKATGGDPVVSLASLGLAVDDLMLAVGVSTGAQTLTPPAGWSTHPNSISTARPLYYKFADASDVATPSFTFVSSGVANTQVTISVYRDVNKTNPFSGTAGSVATTSTTMTIAGANPAGPCTLAQIVGKLGLTSYTPPGTATERFDHSVGVIGSTAGGDEAIAASGAINRTWTAAAGTASGVGYAVGLRQKTVQQALTTTMTGVASLRRQVGRVLSATMTGVATLSRRQILHHTLSATMTGVATLARKITGKRVLFPTMTGVPSLARKVTAKRVLSVVMVGVPSIRRLTRHALVAVMTGVPTVARKVTGHRTLAVVMVGVAIIRSKTGKPLAAVMVGVASMSRRVGKRLSVVMVGVPTVRRKVARSLSAVMVGVPVLNRRGQTHRTLAVTMQGNVSLTRAVTTGRTMLAAMIGVPTIDRANILGRVLSAIMVGIPKGLAGFPFDQVPSGGIPDWSPNDGLKSISGDVFFHEPPHEGEPVSGATVTLIRDVDGKRIATTLTDGGGHYEFGRDTNDPYTYHVEVTYTDGFTAQQGLSEGGCVPT